MSRGDEFDKRDWYDILGISAGATDAEIGRAFRHLARRYHPDVSADRNERSDRRFDEVTRAYEVLGDPGRRAEYDRARSGRSSPIGRAIRIPVHQHHTRSVDARDTHPSEPPPTTVRNDMEVKLSPRESIVGTTRQLSIRVREACSSCEGSGHSAALTCARCDGRGRFDRSAGSIVIHHVCERCGGSGFLAASICSDCQGQGTIEVLRTMTVRIPPGTWDGARLRVQRGGGGPQDAVRIVVRVDPR